MRQATQLSARNDLIRRLRQAQLACDSQGRARMIACHHAHIDAGLPAGLDRGRHLRADRVYEPDESEKAEARRRVGRVEPLR